MRVVKTKQRLGTSIKRFDVYDFDHFKSLNSLLVDVIDKATKLIENVLEDSAIKIQLIVDVKMYRDEAETYAPFLSYTLPIINKFDVDSILNKSDYEIMELFSNFLFME